MHTNIFKILLTILNNNLFHYINQLDDSEKKIWILINGGDNYLEWCKYLNKLLDKVNTWKLKIRVEAIISNNWNWWVRKEAYDSGISFERIKYISTKWDNGEYLEEQLDYIQEVYQNIIKKYWLEYIFFVWWNEYITWILPNKSINTFIWNEENIYNWSNENEIYMKLFEDYKSWIINETYINICFQDQNNTKWPMIAKIPVNLENTKNISDIKKCIYENKINNLWKVYELILTNDISWSWNKGDKLITNDKKIKLKKYSNGIIFLNNNVAKSTE